MSDEREIRKGRIPSHYDGFVYRARWIYIERTVDTKTTYSNAERLWLSLAGAISLLGLNVAFLYGVLAVPGALREAMRNPIALAFMLEAFLLVALLAYLLNKWEVTRLSWPVFVLLSLAGGIVFALPVVLLWRSRRESGISGKPPGPARDERPQ